MRVMFLTQRVCSEIEGDESGSWTAGFARPGDQPVRGDDGAACAVRVECEDWKDLFERKQPAQVTPMSDRVRAVRFAPGAPAEGLHFVYALQALFP